MTCQASPLPTIRIRPDLVDLDASGGLGCVQVRVRPGCPRPIPRKGALFLVARMVGCTSAMSCRLGPFRKVAVPTVGKRECLMRTHFDMPESGKRAYRLFSVGSSGRASVWPRA